jgi:O-antigen/teichoic acid export membrane protein
LNPLRKLAGQTAIYGMSTILGRLLNYALVPFYTYIFGAPADFGLNTEFYAYISFLNVVFTYGMETALFNFSSREPDKNKVYSTALISLVSTTLILTLPVVLGQKTIAEWLRYSNGAEFVVWCILIVATDAICAIPFAKLREENKSRRFALLKLTNIFINLFLNFFFIGLCKYHFDHQTGSYWASWYNPQIGIGYAFVANLVANLVVMLLLLPEFRRIKYGFDFSLWKRMIVYALPLLVVGLAGMVNETLDRILLKYLLPAGISMTEVGIYGACYKISILMTIFRQAFQYAAEPFFFSNQKEKENRDLYARVMNYFVIACAIIFLGTTMNMSWIQYFVGEKFRVGIGVVPILLMANLFLGIYFNLSIWYKLTQKTQYGAYITVFGAIITLTLNWIWIPSSGYFGGYMGSAWATLICYGLMMILSWYFGQKYYPVNYDLKRIFSYLFVAIVLFAIGTWTPIPGGAFSLIFKNTLVVAFALLIFYREKPLQLIRRK